MIHLPTQFISQTLSASNYGLGKDNPGPDKDSDGSLFNLSENNNFSRVDGVTNLTPNSSVIRYICIYPQYDYEQDAYLYYGGGHALNPVNTARLGNATFYEIAPGYGLGYPENSNPENPVPLKNLQNHSKLIADRSLFEDYVLPNLNN
jgi:hypothetical protein